MSVCAVFKLECLKIKRNMNHFALRAKLLVKATQQAYQALQTLKGA
jgi:DNA-binding ferritin-like protein (Dps family)